MTDPQFAVPPGTPHGTAIYDYGVVSPRRDPEISEPLQCPCGRTDKAEHAEQAIAEHLGHAPVGSRAAILVRNMTRDGRTGPALLYALAERGEHSVTWPTYNGSRTPGAREP